MIVLIPLLVLNALSLDNTYFLRHLFPFWLFRDVIRGKEERIRSGFKVCKERERNKQDGR